MRIDITADGVEPLVLTATRTGDRGNIWLVQDGLDGWYGTPKPNESATSVPQRDGGYWPSRLTSASRTLTVKGAAAGLSAVETAHLRDRVCALACLPLTVTVHDAAGARSVTGFLADDPEPSMFATEHAFRFTLVISCPDPFKYGRPVVWRQYKAGLIHVANAGNAPSWPLLRSTGATSFDITFQGRRVSWKGAAAPLELDFTDMIPSQGTVSHDDAFQIPPGAWDLTVAQAGSPDISMTVSPAWR
ncbi:hypothetical protein [Bifidobacterium stellenboschense]|uniref:Uncharacterized protein n=1 Tax=Bifidobacterium stellenboschense TaxID=762211 RepID=A0A087DQK9_9BIFI|nr:hypothetical protein [Bifidobacterium stellenboschense]KFI97809.1 hypothetical protein BSTEL_0620 [Bifidobacterium stellenboschense]